MLLQYLIENTEVGIIGNTNKNINKIEYDSEKINKDDIFVAIEGLKEDGHNYIEEAINLGANTIVIDINRLKEIEERFKKREDITIITSVNTRRTLAIFASKYYDNPATKLKMIGITGTKGKTTTAYMIRDIMLAAGKKIGMIGTIENTFNDKKIEATRTSPESLDLQHLLHDMVEAKTEYCVMEVSSHALILDRIYGIMFDISIFTNLSREHLDFHETMENYLEAKAKLFKNSLFAVINTDDIYATKLLKKIKCKVAKYGLDNDANVTATDIRINNTYVDFKMYINKQLQTIKVNIPGRYTVYNALGAISATSILGCQMQDILVGLSNTKVPGRSEIVDINKSFAVLIDYAHTPSSLEAILINTKKYIRGRVICVFGCGGNRDIEKRKVMGEIAGKYSNFTIITSDNPRDEEPNKIISQIEEGIKLTKGLYKIIPNRKEAIEFAMKIAWKNDTIILAGKGHEKYQEIKKKKLPFDEREIVKKAAENMPGKNEISY